MASKRLGIAALALASMAGSAPGCGSGDDAPEAFGDHPEDPLHCPQFTPCGGDVTGSWEFDAFCLSGSNYTAECQPDDAAWSVAAGPMTFSTDGTMRYQIALAEKAYRRYSPECSVDACPPSGADGTCARTSDGSCSCASDRLPLTDLMDPEPGPIAWWVEGTQLFLQAAFQPEVCEYCVHGDTMDVFTTSSAGHDAEKYFRLRRAR